MFRVALLVFMLAMTLGSPLVGGRSRIAAQEATPAECPATTEEENMAVVQRYYDLVDEHDFEGLRDVYAPVIYRHAADNPDAQGIDEAVNNLYVFLEAFPDLDMETEQLMADGNLVAARVFQSGTHERDFFGVPATGNHATWAVIGIFLIECGLITEQWVEVDQVGRLMQLDAWPTSGSSGAATPSADSAEAVASPLADCPATTEDENAELVRRWHDEVWSQGDLSNFDELIAPNHVHHRVLNRLSTGSAAREATVRQWRESFPDFANTPDFLMTDGDKVVARWTASGTHEGPWQDVAPTGKTVTWTGNTIYRIECGRIAEEWSEAASLSFFEQMGVNTSPQVPPRSATPTTA